MIRSRCFVLLLNLLLAALPLSAKKDYTQFVNPYIGSGGHGHVFVGANVPFSAVQLGPMNIFKGWDWCSGYHYSDSVIIGFSHNHLSGTGCDDLGDISLMPYSGEMRTKRGDDHHLEGAASSKFSHDNEVVSPGYYAVKLDNGVNVELTTTERVGVHRYNYTKAETPRVLIDLFNGIGNKSYEAYIRKIDDTTVEGYRFVNGWAPQHKVFFYAKFNQPIQSLDVFHLNSPAGTDELQGRDVKAVATFKDGMKELLVKVAISSVSCTNAKLNLEKEMTGWNFDNVHQVAIQKWNDVLSRIEIEGTPRQKTIFYTAMYHAFIAPNLYCDVNGDFRGIDDKVYRNNKFKNYTTLSLWDTYRTLHPLFTIIARKEVPDMINSMLSIYDQNGKLPIWPLYSGETNCMPGYSSVPVIADAYLKGIGGFDANKALDYMISTATNPKQNGVKDFMHYGYIPADAVKEATSIQLEYAADDMGIALMAKKMGRMDVYHTFLKRALSYQTIFDSKINKIHPKMKDGSWYEPYDPFLANERDGVGDFCEGNGWQYTFMVPQDPDGLIKAHGGEVAFMKNLDELFVAEGDLGEGAPPDVSGMVGQYAHGNEPNHHTPYLYVYAGHPYKTAEKVRMLQNKFYTDEPDGYCGNEDCGQMSAWHIMSALGFYQVNPSNGIFVFGSPLFKKATIHLPEGKTFVITAPNNNDKNVYIKSAQLNGRNLKTSYITYSDVMKGGVLNFQMSNRPNKSFGKAKQHRPVSAK